MSIEQEVEILRKIPMFAKLNATTRTHIQRDGCCLFFIVAQLGLATGSSYLLSRDTARAPNDFGW